MPGCRAYRRFAGKDALVRAVLLRELRRFFAAIDEAVSGIEANEDRLVEGFAFALQFLHEHAPLNRFLRTEPELLLPYLTVDAGPVLDAAATADRHRRMRRDVRLLTPLGYDVLSWHLLPQALALATPAAVCAVVLAVAMARVLVPDRVPAGGQSKSVVLAAVLAGVVAFTVPLSRGGEAPYVADIAVKPVGDGSRITVAAHFDDPRALDGAEWLQVFAWQGRRTHPGADAPRRRRHLGRARADSDHR